MAQNSTFQVENAETAGAAAYAIRRVGSTTWEAVLPWATLGDAISTLTAAAAATAPALVRGSTFQVSLEADFRSIAKWQWLGIQSAGSFVSLYKDELMTLVPLLTAVQSETDTPVDLDGDGPKPLDPLLLPPYLAEDALTATFVSLKAAAKNPDLLIVGAVTLDGDELVTSAAVVWPDGSPGTLTITSRDSNDAVTAYNITYGSPVTRTYTQPTITRNANGAATNVPQIVVS